MVDLGTSNVLTATWKSLSHLSMIWLIKWKAPTGSKTNGSAANSAPKCHMAIENHSASNRSGDREPHKTFAGRRSLSPITQMNLGVGDLIRHVGCRPLSPTSLYSSVGRASDF